MLRLLTIMFVGLLFQSLAVQAADCVPANITLRTQSEVDNFQAVYGGGGTCDTVIGALQIGLMETGNDIANLDGLAAITEVKGTVGVRGFRFNDGSGGFDNKLVDIDGIQSLTNVGGSFSITQTGVPVISGFSGLASIGGGLSFSGNVPLSSISGFENLASAGGIDIGGLGPNSSLKSVDGFGKLTSLGGLRIDGVGLERIPDFTSLSTIEGDVVLSPAGVSDFSGFPTLARIGGKIDIYNTAALLDISGFPLLSEVGEFVQIRGSDSLKNISGFGKINSFPELFIYGNATLESITGFANLQSLGTLSVFSNPVLFDISGLISLRELVRKDTTAGNLSVYDNFSLADCSPLNTVLGAPYGPPEDSVDGVIRVNSNAIGCNSLDEIFQGYMGVPSRPLGVSATPGATESEVSFSPPETDGGSAISGYTASCGSSSSTALSSPITVTGLTSDTEYSCSVVATNAAGDSLPSEPAFLATNLAAFSIAEEGNGWKVFEARFTPDATGPENYELPFGTVYFQLYGGVIGSTATVTVEYAEPVPAGAEWWKYGPTPDDPSYHWYEFPGAAISGNKVTFSITDGGIGDTNLSGPDGSIEDPSGLAIPISPPTTPPGGAPPKPVPTMPIGWLLVLIMILLGTGLRQRGR
jgi:Fibronectin type III domain